MASGDDFLTADSEFFLRKLQRPLNTITSAARVVESDAGCRKVAGKYGLVARRCFCRSLCVDSGRVVFGHFAPNAGGKILGLAILRSRMVIHPIRCAPQHGAVIHGPNHPLGRGDESGENGAGESGAVDRGFSATSDGKGRSVAGCVSPMSVFAPTGVLAVVNAIVVSERYDDRCCARGLPIANSTICRSRGRLRGAGQCIVGQGCRLAGVDRLRLGGFGGRTIGNRSGLRHGYAVCFEPLDPRIAGWVAGDKYQFCFHGV